VARAVDALGLLKIEVREGAAQSICTYCHGNLGEEPRATCFGCTAIHHHDCFLEHGECAACGRAPLTQPALDEDRTPPPRYQRSALLERTPAPGYEELTLFRCWVIDTSGQEHGFRLRARDRAAVRDLIRRRGLVLVKVELADGEQLEPLRLGRLRLWWILIFVVLPVPLGIWTLFYFFQFVTH
jgi:hypothetical protein